jgi:hypothetical protein
MSNEKNRPEMRRLWQGQAVEDTSLSLDELRSALAKLNRVERARTLAYGLVSLMFVVTCGALLIGAAPIPIVRGAACFFALGAGFFFFQAILGLRRAPGKLLTQGEPEACATFYRSALVRQQKFFRRSALWMPLLISACSLPVVLLAPPLRGMMIAVWVLLVPFWIYESLETVRRSQRELDKLDASFK